MASLLRRALERGGLRGRHRRGPARTRSGWAPNRSTTPIVLDVMLPAAGRLRGVPHAPGARSLGAGPAADRPRRGARTASPASTPAPTTTSPSRSRSRSSTPRLRALTAPRRRRERPTVLEVGDLALDPAGAHRAPRREVRRPEPEGVRAARAVHAPPGRGAEPDRDARARLGLRVRRDLERHRRLRALPAREDRPPVRAATRSRPCAASDTGSAPGDVLP